MKILVLLFAALLVAGCGEKSSDSVTLPLSDANVERLLKEAVALSSLEGRDGLRYQVNESEPFSGWAKEMYDSGYGKGLMQLKDGKPHGTIIVWHENGQKEYEGTYKDGKADGPQTGWHENGQKFVEATFKDGEQVSAKYWNSKGEEVETREEALEKPATEPSADTAKPPPAESPVADSPSEEPSETPKSLSDADVEQIVKEAVEIDSLEERNDLIYQLNESEPYSGWVKIMHDSGQVQGLAQYKDGKLDGPATVWHENGQKLSEATYKDGRGVSEKYWNSKGEEVETAEESRK